MAQLDNALEYLHYLGRGGKYSALRYDDVFRSIQSYALRKGLTNEILIELVKLWLKIKIPQTQWTSLGYCLVPVGKVSDDVVHAVMRWILGNHSVEKNFFRTVAALNWLTGLFEYNLVSEEALNLYYEFYFSFLHNDKFLIPCAKLVYNLTKLQDVNRCNVNSIVKLMDKKRSSRHLNCLIAVLNLLKSFRPECVPEEVPSVSVNVAFTKMNKLYAERFEQAQIRSNTQLSVTTHDRLVWWTAEGKNNRFSKKQQTHLVPDLEYMQLGAVIYTSNGKQKKCFDFSSTHNILVFHFGQRVEIPANILSLLVNDAGLHIVHFSDSQSQMRFSNVLYHTLHNSFLNSNNYLSYNEKRHFLRQITKLQCRLMQGIPVVSRFLAQYIATWNGSDFFDEILDMLEWIIFKSYGELYDCVLEHIECLYLSGDCLYRCSLLNTLGKMYTNIHSLLTTNRKLLFISRSDDLNAVDTLSNLFDFIDELCIKTINTYPDDLILRHSLLSLYETLAHVQLTSPIPLWNVLPAALTYTILSSWDGFCINRLLGLILGYTSIYEKVKAIVGKGPIKSQITLLEKYTSDIANCLWFSKCLSWRRDGLMLKNLPKHVQMYIDDCAKDFDKYLDVSNHFAFTMMYQNEMSSGMNYNNDFMLKSLHQYFNNVNKFIETVVWKTMEAN